MCWCVCVCFFGLAFFRGVFFFLFVCGEQLLSRFNACGFFEFLFLTLVIRKKRWRTLCKQEKHSVVLFFFL